MDDVIILPMLVVMTLKFIPKDMIEKYRKEAEGMWHGGKPKKWYYAIPIVVIWLLVLLLILKVLFKR